MLHIKKNKFSLYEYAKQDASHLNIIYVGLLNNLLCIYVFIIFVMIVPLVILFQSGSIQGSQILIDTSTHFQIYVLF